MILNMVTLFPTHLDLNGDQANLKVLAKRLEWFGQKSVISAVNKGDLLPKECDLIFVGHGSLAAWKDIEADFSSLLPEILKKINEGTAFFAVASGYEESIRLGIFSGELVPCERISKFEVSELDGLKILGYLNAATKAPAIQRDQLLLGTQLHGPLLAKNPKLADHYISEIMASKGLNGLHSNLEAGVDNKNVALVDDIVEDIWKLETELASE